MTQGAPRMTSSTCRHASTAMQRSCQAHDWVVGPPVSTHSTIPSVPLPVRDPLKPARLPEFGRGRRGRGRRLRRCKPPSQKAVRERGTSANCTTRLAVFRNCCGDRRLTSPSLAPACPFLSCLTAHPLRLPVVLRLAPPESPCHCCFRCWCWGQFAYSWRAQIGPWKAPSPPWNLTLNPDAASVALEGAPCGPPLPVPGGMVVAGVAWGWEGRRMASGVP